LGQKRVSDWLYMKRGYNTLCMNIEVADTPKEAYDYSDIGDVYASKQAKMLFLEDFGKFPGLVKPIRIEAKQVKFNFTCANDWPKFGKTWPYVIVVAKHRHDPPPWDRKKLPKPYCYIHISRNGFYCAIMYSRDESKWTVQNIKHNQYANYGVDNYMMHKDEVFFSRLLDVTDP
jgi:hypothetical protein